jgi:flagellar assembly factor FliW
MQIETSRFGSLELKEADVIRFPAGLIGFPNENSFMLIQHGGSGLLGWLQSTTSPALAFPVVSAHGLVQEYPDVLIEPVAERAGLGDDAAALAVLAVLSAPTNQPATVNLLAPLIVNAVTRTGAQVFLDGSRYSTQELFGLSRATSSQVPQKSAETAAP